jgi:2-keto-3-deoxy-L-rhamnonate aldolase RhmA
MTDQNPLLERLAAGGAVSCHWMALGSAAAAEVMAEARPDAIIFDTQHGLWDKQNLYSAFAAIRGKSQPVVRIADDSAAAIGEAYDLGAAGVIVPLVETAAQAKAIVQAAKYPPLGRRSAGGVRPMLDFNPYAAAANRSLLLGVMIETVAGLKNAAAIAAVPGVDLVFIGTGTIDRARDLPRQRPEVRTGSAIDPVRLPQGQDALRPLHLSHGHRAGPSAPGLPMDGIGQ